MDDLDSHAHSSSPSPPPSHPPLNVRTASEIDDNVQANVNAALGRQSSSPAPISTHSSTRRSPTPLLPATSSRTMHARIAHSLRQSDAMQHITQASPSPASSHISTPHRQSPITLPIPAFRNQVAGHGQLYWHRGSILKPLLYAEYNFYARLIEKGLAVLRPFVPRYYGVVDPAQLSDDIAHGRSPRYVHKAGSKSDGEEESGEYSSDGEMEKVRRRRVPTVVAAASAASTSTSLTPSAPPLSTPAPLPPLPPTSSTLSLSSTLNSPASASLSQSGIGRSPPLQLQYLVLEDLTYGFELPCVLDLKLGYRQHASNEPPHKIASKSLRYENGDIRGRWTMWHVLMYECMCLCICSAVQQPPVPVSVSVSVACKYIIQLHVLLYYMINYMDED